MKKSVMWLPLMGVLVVPLLLSGCGGDDDDDGITGTWRLTSVTANGQTSACPSAACGQQTYRFFGDNTHEIRTSRDGNHFFSSGTYSYNGLTLILTTTRSGSDLDHDGEVEPNEIQTVTATPSITNAELAEDVLTITEPNTGNVFRLERQ